MMVDSRTLTRRPLADLIGAAHPDNEKGHDAPTIVASLRRFGLADVPVVDGRTGLILSGHGRVEALADLEAAGEPPPDGIDVDESGAWLVPIVDGWASTNDDEAAAARVALNRTTETGGWIDDSLAATLERLATLDDGLAGVGSVTTTSTCCANA